jgi:hypothetical protein
MTESTFACFNATATHLKVVKMSEMAESRTRVEACEQALGQTFTVRTSREPAPTLTLIVLESGERLYLWRTSLCVYTKSTRRWIHILDSNCMELIPGEFRCRETCMSRLFRGSRERRLRQRRREMLRSVWRQEELYVQGMRTSILPPTAPPQLVVPQPTQARVPAFLGHIIKRDAVRNRDTCPVTLENFTEEIKAAVTPCFHLFTEAGLCGWLKTKAECPTCKAPVDTALCLFL